MKQLTKREKNLGVLVVFAAGLALWWFLDRGLSKKTEILEAELHTVRERIRTAGALLASAKEQSPEAAHAVSPAAQRLPEGKITISLLKDLTLPQEIENLRILSVNRADGKNYSMIVEGKFSEMMRFLSFLEREESRFGVGNVDLGRMSEDPNGNGARQIRAQMQLYSKG